jgi:YbgC/YbaW family acyl-CoA thioester hydrolase
LRTIKEEMRVRWGETDSAGIAHFTSFFVYFEVAEQKLFRDVLKINPRDKFGPDKIVGLPRVESYCQYFSPARFDDLLEVELRVAALGRTSISYEFSIQNKTSGKLSASGKVKVIAVNESFQSVEIPKEIAELLK